MPRHPNVTNVDEQEGVLREHGERYRALRKNLGQAAGGKQIGCSLYTVPPGKTGFPFHFHRVNEEAIYILAGEGTMRIGEARVPVRAGDYIAFPVTGQGHQLLNTSSAEITYLVVSTMQYPEVGEYPDSNKVGIFTGPATPQNPESTVRRVFRNTDTADYYEGE